MTEINIFFWRIKPKIKKQYADFRPKIGKLVSNLKMNTGCGKSYLIEKKREREVGRQNWMFIYIRRLTKEENNKNMLDDLHSHIDSNGLQQSYMSTRGRLSIHRRNQILLHYSPSIVR